MVLLPAHVEGARGILKMSQADLAELSGVSLNTIRFFESGRTTTLRDETLCRIQAALESCGIEFLNGGRPGVRYHPDRDRRRLARSESANPID